MATPLTNAINAMTDYANIVTGRNDANLSEAFESLCDNYKRSSGNLMGAELWDSDQEVYTLSDTNFANITPSTSSQTILAAGSTWKSFDADVGHYGYLIINFSMTEYAYTTTPADSVTYGVLYKTFNYRMLGGVPEYNSVTPITTYYNTLVPNTLNATRSMLFYHKANAASGISNSDPQNYGCIAAIAAPTQGNEWVSNSSTTIAVTITKPAIFCQGNATYFSVDALNLLDAANTKLYRRYEIWRYPAEQSLLAHLTSTSSYYDRPAEV